ncbi:MAG: NUDIX hydrolase [Actinobacteria bacterium]|nr:NUDIX hydrolase [Actinomycetota bacterium]
MRDWLVAGAVIRSADGLLLVKNQRRDGRSDWTPPGGVVDPGETLLDGLTREVAEETGLVVEAWSGRPLYRIEAIAVDLEWRLSVEVHLAVAVRGDLTIDDPDGIVVEASWVRDDQCLDRLSSSPPWVRDPLGSWLADPWEDDTRDFRYRIEGRDLASMRVDRLD